jgi:hypothetical protein
MHNIENYFNAPIFESKKSLYACRYQNKLEFELMKKLEEAPKVKSFHQPLLMALVRNADEERFIHIDFWVEFQSGKIELLFIEKDHLVSDEAKITILSNAVDLLKAKKVEFAVLSLRKNRYRRITSSHLNMCKTASTEDFCFVNFGWIN